MSNLNPGGSRSQAFHRIYGAENIKRAVQRNVHSRDPTKGAEHSLAGRPHTHSREIARRLRQKGNTSNGR